MAVRVITLQACLSGTAEILVLSIKKCPSPIVAFPFVSGRGTPWGSTSRPEIA
jgi:hypothetical protein